MSDWADEWAQELILEDVIEQGGQITVIVAQALREAEARGIERAINNAPCPTYPVGNRRFCGLAFGDDKDCDCWKSKLLKAAAGLAVEEEDE